MRVALAIAILGVSSVNAEASTRFSNGPQRTALIELFTSEGCSSCPVADAWLRGLRAKPGLWRDFVPVEFHVNYWDSLGWKDRFSTAETTEREYAYAAAWGCQPYTPCFARNGVQWKPGWGTVPGPGAPMGVLSIDVGDDGNCRVEFTPGPAIRAPEDGSFEAHVALLGGGLFSDVTGGENGGTNLLHEFVVLGIASRGLAPADGKATQQGTIRLPHPIVSEGTRRALAVWVTLRGEMEPLQATGGWLPQVPGG
jgi:hypothetical protein